ncbi:chaperone modulator CbpM [Acetobacteraceae bacterium KSS8]|uniref:Chaperone modulator CbpM n=1 Tax=Endosaccharibacter trunci TaxID=2812733 RepID=A0ABT1W2N0_9PROT|nr:chaperone modulator CbpM [Acetobacteraceae bacterium KSS8]
MITADTLCLRITRVTPVDLEEWVARRWLRPDGEPGAWLFRPIDEARVRLIVELRYDLHIDDEALPLVLSLLDQLYAERRHLGRVRDALMHEDAGRLREVLVHILDAAQTGR